MDFLNNHCHIISEVDGVLLRYLYYYLHTVSITDLVHGNIPKLTQGDFRKLKIVVPPLTVQEEIVRILDTFTELTAELQAELQGRRKQFEWYRDNLLSFDNSATVARKAVEEVSYLVQPTMKIKSNNYLRKGKYPIIDQGQEYIGGYTNEDGAFPHAEYIVFGDHTCVVKYVNFPFVQGANGVKVIRAKNEVIPKYLYYCMSSIKMEVDYSRHWSKMRVQQIPIPSLAEQDRIVEILDSFDKYCNDLSQGLPKEIELRQKQYEYYRDKLLTFKEKSA